MRKFAEESGTGSDTSMVTAIYIITLAAYTAMTFVAFSFDAYRGKRYFRVAIVLLWGVWNGM